MELSLYLAQLLGLYFLLAGAIVILQQKALIPIVGDFSESRVLISLLAFAELAAGLAIVLVQPSFTFDWQGLITFVGAWMIIESVFFLMAPSGRSKRIIRRFNIPVWYTGGGLIAIAVGLYLAGIGFELL
jgi:hypothetical protein